MLEFVKSLNIREFEIAPNITLGVMQATLLQILQCKHHVRHYKHTTNMFCASLLQFSMTENNNRILFFFSFLFENDIILIIIK